jgi:hypothetical protein
MVFRAGVFFGSDSDAPKVYTELGEILNPVLLLSAMLPQRKDRSVIL